MPNRTQYTPHQKEMVQAKYHLCRTPEDRDALAKELGIGSRQKLYNLASRLNATRPHANSHAEWTSEEDGYDATKDTQRLYLRDDFETLEWSEDNDRYLTEHFGRTFIESIAFMLNRTESATAYRARQLGLRNVPKYYNLEKVSPWLGLNYRAVLLLAKKGLEIHPCTDRHGRLKVTLISTTSLARVLVKDRFWKVLVDKYGADEFFIRDVVESVVSLQKGEINWEPNCWVSHGHTCLNPYSDASFGWFYDGYDDKMVGEDLDPRDLAPSANVAGDSWKRGSRVVPINDEHDELDTEDVEELAGAAA